MRGRNRFAPSSTLRSHRTAHCAKYMRSGGYDRNVGARRVILSSLSAQPTIAGCSRYLQNSPNWSPVGDLLLKTNLRSRVFVRESVCRKCVVAGEAQYVCANAAVWKEEKKKLNLLCTYSYVVTRTLQLTPKRDKGTSFLRLCPHARALLFVVPGR